MTLPVLVYERSEAEFLELDFRQFSHKIDILPQSSPAGQQSKYDRECRARGKETGDNFGTANNAYVLT
jgi:hypothetical protein